MPMKLGQQQRRGPGRGSRKGDRIRVLCEFEEESFNEVYAFAVKQNTSLSEAIRILIQWGLDEA